MIEWSNTEENGKAVCRCNGQEKEFEIPQSREILKMMIQKIKQVGFTNVEVCLPNEANCIIRTYQHLHHEYLEGMYNLYGPNCYTKSEGLWITCDGFSMYLIDYSRHQIRYNLLPDECLCLNVDFVDYYVRIS